MLLDLIYGGVGSGKTERCIELIERTLAKNPGHTAILTVPDQYSYTTEKRLVDRLGGTGLNRVEVLTFSQFFRRYLRTGQKTLGPQGRQALIYRAVSVLRGSENNIFANSLDKPGFIQKVSDLMSEMTRYLISADELRACAEDEQNPMLSQKLAAFATIFEAYHASVKPELCDSEDDFSRFAEWIQNSDEFQTTHIWFDGFSDFLPQHDQVIRSFLLSAQSVHVTLCMPSAAVDEEGVFAMPKKTRDKLCQMADEAGARIYEQTCSEECYTISSPEIVHLMQNWDHRKRIFDGRPENISLFCARNLYSETQYVAERILFEVKNGARYRDIGVMCNDMPQYAHLIEAVFGDYKIPYFSDSQMQVTDHPIILTVLAAFQISEENWSFESVFSYLRAGFVYVKEGTSVHTLDRGQIDLLENYVLSRGIRGKRTWLGEQAWEANSHGVFDSVLGEENAYDSDIDIDQIEAVRHQITAPFVTFYEKTAGRHTILELAEALYQFLLDIHLFEGLQMEINDLNEKGMRNEAERMKEIWNLLMETLDQVVAASGEQKCSKDDFSKILQAALSVSSLQIIPPGLDSVSVSAADRNAPSQQKIVFFMGTVSGTMPTQSVVEGILTDSERRVLEQKGLEMAKDSAGKAAVEMFKCYRAVTSAGERIYFSYPTADSEGGAKQPSNFVRDLYRMFPNMAVSDDLMEGEEDVAFTPKQAFNYIMNSVSRPKLRAKAQKLAQLCSVDEGFKKKLNLVRRAQEYRENQPKISRENAKMLYNDYHRYSVSRLSDYSGCPFSYFVKHGLKAKEQEVWQIQKFEMGSLLHKAVCDYCQEVEAGAESFEEVTARWRALTVDASEQIVDAVMTAIEEMTLARLSRNKGMVAYILRRMRRIVLRSVEVVRLSLSQGAYTAVCYEQKFQIDIQWDNKTVGLNGTIDRVDAAMAIGSGQIELRVIDYKSGRKDFDVVSVSNGRDMQLVVYAIAAVELYKKGALGRAEGGLSPSVGGILYNKLRNDMVTSDDTDPAVIEKKVQDAMRMDGVIVVDEDEVEAAVKMDSNLEQGGVKSAFLPLAVNSKGDALNKRSSKVMARDRFDVLTAFVQKTVVRLDSKIFEGKIAAVPAKQKGEKNCRFCEYKDICLYDDRGGAVRKGNESEAAAWDFMSTETGGTDK